MRKFLLILIASLVIIPAHSIHADAIGVRVVQSGNFSKVLWDYDDSGITQFNVVAFNVCYDTTNCSKADLTSKVSTTSGLGTYSVVIPTTLKNGNHIVTVAACDSTVCGDMAGPLAFTLSFPIPAPKNLRGGS